MLQEKYSTHWLVDNLINDLPDIKGQKKLSYDQEKII